jgi:GNAT superfamily N-acetyltransferase
MSFWNDYKIPSWWACLDRIEPTLLEGVEEIYRPIPPIPNIHLISLCQESHTQEISNLLRNHFSNNWRCRTELSPKEIKEGIQKKGWIGVVAHESSTNRIVGCAFSIGAKYKDISCGIVDFFCVSPSWRKKGLGRCLLRSLVNATASQNRILHFFIKEGMPLFCMPPLYQGNYIWRKTQKQGKSSPTPGFLFINLYHRSLPEGHSLGELSLYPKGFDPEKVENAIDHSGFDILIMDSKFPHLVERGWKNDSTYQWYCFNFHPGSFFQKEPPFIQRN